MEVLQHVSLFQRVMAWKFFHTCKLNLLGSTECSLLSALLVGSVNHMLFFKLWGNDYLCLARELLLTLGFHWKGWLGWGIKQCFT